MIGENLINPGLKVDDVIKSIALMQNHEERWDTLKISEISVPRVEVSLWSSFMKFFNPSNTDRALDTVFEKGDIYDLKIREFELFQLAKIRKSEKDSLTFCVIKSKLAGKDQVYFFQVLVKLPIRE